MNKLHRQRLIYLSIFSLSLGIATSLILYALQQNINVFLTPSQVTTLSLTTHYHFRLGGLVKKQSVIYDTKTLGVQFVITDLKHDVLVHYTGILPDLFHEGKGVIADGSLDAKGVFTATEVLAKHDENYMPKKISQSLGKRTS